MEVISRAEAYLNYALKNQETYPKPISRIDYYLLSLAQEVRAGGADPATITEAVNTYLAANPVQAMTDEQIATSVNKSISDGTIEVMSEVEDGSITKNKLDTDLFYNKWTIEQTSGSWRELKFVLDKTYKDTTLKAEFYVTPTTTQTVAIQKSNQSTNTIKFIAGQKQFFSVEVALDSTGANCFILGSVNGMSYNLSGVYEDVVITINDKIIPITDVTVSTGTVTKGTKEIGFIVTKEELNSEIEKINEKASDISVYNLNSNLWGNKYRIDYVDGSWLTTTFKLDKTYTNCVLEFSAYITLDNTTSMCVGARTNENTVRFTANKKIKVTKTLEIDDTGISSFELTTPSGMTYNYSGVYENICITIDGKLVQYTISLSQSTATIQDLTNKSGFVYTQNETDNKLEEAKEYTNNKFDNISSNIAEDSIELEKLKETYPLDKSMSNTYINKLVKEMKIFGEYKTEQTSQSTTFDEKDYSPINYWFNTFENVFSSNSNNIKIVLENSNGEKWEFKHGVGSIGAIPYKELKFYDTSHRLRAIIWIDDWNLFSTTKFTSEYQILEGTGNKDNALIDKRCIIPTYRNIKEKFDLPMPDRLYAVATINKEARYALPVYLDYVQGYSGMYKDTKDSILFKGGSDVKYLAPSPNNEDKNLYIYSKNFKFESEKYLVDDKKVKLVSTGLSQKIKEPLKILIIGDSVTAGAITQQQYWAFAGDYFAKEDLITDRDSKVMFLGTNNYRDTTVTYGEKTKQVHTCACGISSWSLKHWLTEDNEGRANGFTYTDDEGNVQFSFLKWLERYRNYDDEGNKLSIGDSNLGTMVTESNIDKIQCCTPNIILINSTHNGGSIEEHLKIAEIARKEIPNVKIIITAPMPLLGTWEIYNYVDRDWIEDGLEFPNYGGGMNKITDCIAKSKYWAKYEQYNDDVYIFPITWLTPTVEGFEWDEYKVGNSDKIIKRATTKPLPKEHPGTFTHSIWGYELYSLLKYIGIKDKDGLTSNEETITLDNTTLTINYGDTATLTATSDNSSSVLKYYSSDETIATVDEDTGVITPVSGGTCKIWVHGDYAIKPVYCTVTIQVNVTGVEFTDEEITVAVGSTVTLGYTTLPTDATNKNVTFSVDNSNVTITDEGVITGVTEGTSVVTITTEEGSFTDTITINVVSELTLDIHNTLMANSSYWKQGEYEINNGKFTTGDGTRIAYEYHIKVEPSTSYTLTTNNTSTKFVVRGLKSDGSLDTSFGAVDNGSSITTTSTTDTLVMTIYAHAGGKTSNELLQMIADGTIVPTITKVTE